MTENVAADWWIPHTQSLPANYFVSVNEEANARQIRNYQPYFIPALLQTAAYIRHMFAAKWPEIAAAELDALVAFRLERQTRALARVQAGEAEFTFIVGEAAIEYVSQGLPRGVGLEQLAHLLQVAHADEPGFHLRSLPFSAGMLPEAEFPFILYDDNTLVQELPTGVRVASNPAQLATYRAAWDGLFATAQEW